MDIPTLEIDTFVRSIGVNRGSPHALFLGAGASMSSGVPAAGACVWQWKKSIFCTNNPGLEEQVAELSLPAVQNRIARWLQVNGFSPDEDQDEYSYFIEKCLPIADDRRRFFEPWVRKARPHVGYRLLCLLAEAGLFQDIWTTNFDGLEQFSFRCIEAIAGGADIVSTLGRREGREGRPHRRPQGGHRARRNGPQAGFEFGKDVFNRIEVGAVGGQVEQVRPSGLDRGAHASHFMAGQIVHHDPVARVEGGDEHLFDIGHKAGAIDWAVQDRRGGEAIRS